MPDQRPGDYTTNPGKGQQWRADQRKQPPNPRRTFLRYKLSTRTCDYCSALLTEHSLSKNRRSTCCAGPYRPTTILTETGIDRIPATCGTFNSVRHRERRYSQIVLKSIVTDGIYYYMDCVSLSTLP